MVGGRWPFAESHFGPTAAPMPPAACAAACHRCPIPSLSSARISWAWVLALRRPNTYPTSCRHRYPPVWVPQTTYCPFGCGRAAGSDRWQDCLRSSGEVRSTGVTIAVLQTNAGPIRIELFDNHAPKTVRNFVGLAEGSQQYTDPRTGQPGSGPYYDGTIFHRVISGFMLQGGDPTGTGRGGPGYQFGDEIHPDLQFTRPYLLAMANAGPGTNGSQFLITVGATTWLNGKHTIFGEVTDDDSRKVVDSIATTRTAAGDRPVEDVVIERVEIQR